MNERNPRSNEDSSPVNDEEIVGTSNDEEFEDVDQIDEDDDSEGVEDIEE